MTHARALALLGRTEDALRALGEVPAMDADAHLLKADLCQALGRTEEAVAACDAAAHLDAVLRDVAYHRKGQLLLAAGRPKEAAAAFDAALGLNPVAAEYWCDAALAWRACGQPSKARKLLDRALDLDPAFERALRLRDRVPPSA